MGLSNVIHFLETHIGVEFDDPADDLGGEGGLLEVSQGLSCNGHINWYFPGVK